MFSNDGYGHFRAPIISLRWNNEKAINIPDVSAFEHYFDLPWKKESVSALLKLSTVPCENFYVGKSGFLASDPIASPYYKINNIEDFLTGSFEA